MHDFTSLLRKSNLKATPPRLRVLAVLFAAHAPLCHAEIEALLAQEAAGPLDKVTLYRVLDALVTHAIAIKSLDQRGVACFSAKSSSSRHHEHLHFHCSGCAQVFCLEGAPPPLPSIPDGFRLDTLSMDVRGACAQCAAQGK